MNKKVNGIREGYWEGHWSNGTLESKGNYKLGKKEGYWEEYYDNGQLACKGNYKSGKMEGYWEVYFSNGDVYYKGFYKKGKIHGIGYDESFQLGSIEYVGKYVSREDILVSKNSGDN